MTVIKICDWCFSQDVEGVSVGYKTVEMKDRLHSGNFTIIRKVKEHVCLDCLAEADANN